MYRFLSNYVEISVFILLLCRSSLPLKTRAFLRSNHFLCSSRQASGLSYLSKLNPILKHRYWILSNYLFRSIESIICYHCKYRKSLYLLVTRLLGSSLPYGFPYCLLECSLFECFFLDKQPCDQVIGRESSLCPPSSLERTPLVLVSQQRPRGTSGPINPLIERQWVIILNLKGDSLIGMGWFLCSWNKS